MTEKKKKKNNLNVDYVFKMTNVFELCSLSICTHF